MKNNYETWTETIISALSDQELIQKKLNMSKSIINRSYSGKIVAQKWKDLLY